MTKSKDAIQSNRPSNFNPRSASRQELKQEGARITARTRKLIVKHGLSEKLSHEQRLGFIDSVASIERIRLWIKLPGERPLRMLRMAIADMNFYKNLLELNFR